jgi:hypothetical protein
VGKYADVEKGKVGGGTLTFVLLLHLRNDTLDAFPAQELFRAESRKEPRAWRPRWTQAGGHLTQGRMIALKDAPVWQAISAFGTPWPPFDYQSGMDLRDISRKEAQRLGLIAPAQTISRPEIGFNDSLQKSVKGYSPEILATVTSYFGDQIAVSDGVAKFQPHLITDFVGKVVSEKNFKSEISLGVATKETVEAAKHLADLEGYELKLTADETRHAIKKHGEGNERDGGQVGLTPKDFASLPDLWRSPGEVLPGDPKKPNTLKFKKDIDGILTMVTWRMNPKQRTLYLQTLWKKKKKSGGGAA